MQSLKLCHRFFRRCFPSCLSSLENLKSGFVRKPDCIVITAYRKLLHVCKVDKYVKKVLAETPGDVEEVIIEKDFRWKEQSPNVFLWNSNSQTLATEKIFP